MAERIRVGAGAETQLTMTLAAAAVETRTPVVARDEARSLHVLTLTPFYPHAADDADGCFVAEPLPWLQKSGVHHTVMAVQPFYRRKRMPSTSAQAAKHVSYKAWPGGVGLASAGTFLFREIRSRVERIHQDRRIDLIHAHGPLPCGDAARWLGTALQLPFVVSVHGLDAMSSRQVNGSVGRRRWEKSREVYASAERVICVSRHVRECLRREVGETVSASVVFNGVDPSLFAPESRGNSACPVILSIGNLIPIKGHETLLRAVAEVSRKRPDVACHIIGYGPQKASLAKLAGELRIADRVQFLGRQGRSAVARALQACTIFALPSTFEALGCVYLEAMACGKPAIGCRHQGIEEIIEDGLNGVLIEPDDAAALACQLERLLDDPALRRRMGDAARQTVLDHLTLQHQAGRLEEIYRECVA
jgi:glycosyltransferase involved in cell wall biosynthesis